MSARNDPLKESGPFRGLAALGDRADRLEDVKK